MSGDSCDEDGARKLKAKIEEYWGSRGFDVTVNLKEEGFDPTMRSARTDVRSNLVNGKPRRRGSKSGPKAGPKPGPSKPEKKRILSEPNSIRTRKRYDL